MKGMKRILARRVLNAEVAEVAEEDKNQELALIRVFL